VGEVRFAPPELNTTIVEGDDDCGSTSSARVVADQPPQLLQQPSVRARNKRALHAEIEKEREALEAANHAPRWMIHPSNRYKKAWDIGIFAVVFYMVYALPYSLGFTNPESELILQPDTEERIALSGYCQEDTPLLPELEPLKYAIILPITPSILDYIDSVTEVIFFIDMILSFRTGYLPKGSGVIEFRSRKVAVNYLKVSPDTYLYIGSAIYHWKVKTARQSSAVEELTYCCVVSRSLGFSLTSLLVFHLRSLYQR
jgi:hypothetical protein